MGVERDPAMADLAAANYADNGHAGLAAEAADILTWRADRTFDHALANPPWHAAAGTASPNPSRRAAKQADADLLALWAAAMARALKPKGTLTLIVPAAALVEAAAALADARCGDVTLLPLYPTLNMASKIIILQGKFLGNGPSRVLAGLLLHDAAGLTVAAERILRHGDAAPLASR